MTDYIDKYISKGLFDIHKLINDDFVLAIKSTWKEQHYVSCLKLLVSFIDTMGFLDKGNSPNAFKQWLGSYVDLSTVGVTADELWEHRNAILHMTTYDSLKVVAGTVARLVPYIGKSGPPATKGSFKYYSLHLLIMAVMDGVQKYVATMAGDDAMRQRFCDNYEKTISDSHFVKN